MTLRDIEDVLRKNREAIRNFGVSEIGVFGSYARGDQKEDSDIDLLVKFKPDQLSFDHYMELYFLLEDSFQKKVDLLTQEQISPFILPHVLDEIVYQKL